MNSYILKRQLPESGERVSAGTLSIGTAGGGCVRSAAFFRCGEVEGEGVSKVELRILPDARRNACPICILYIFSSLLFSIYVCVCVWDVCSPLSLSKWRRIQTSPNTRHWRGSSSLKRIYRWSSTCYAITRHEFAQIIIQHEFAQNYNLIILLLINSDNYRVYLFNTK